MKRSVVFYTSSMIFVCLLMSSMVYASLAEDNTVMNTIITTLQKSAIDETEVILLLRQAASHPQRSDIFQAALRLVHDRVSWQFCDAVITLCKDDESLSFACIPHIFKILAGRFGATSEAYDTIMRCIQLFSTKHLFPDMLQQLRKTLLQCTNPSIWRALLDKIYHLDYSISLHQRIGRYYDSFLQNLLSYTLSSPFNREGTYQTAADFLSTYAVSYVHDKRLGFDSLELIIKSTLSLGLSQTAIALIQSCSILTITPAVIAAALRNGDPEVLSTLFSKMAHDEYFDIAIYHEEILRNTYVLLERWLQESNSLEKIIWLLVHLHHHACLGLHSMREIVHYYHIEEAIAVYLSENAIDISDITQYRPELLHKHSAQILRTCMRIEYLLKVITLSTTHHVHTGVPLVYTYFDYIFLRPIYELEEDFLYEVATLHPVLYGEYLCLAAGIGNTALLNELFSVLEVGQQSLYSEKIVNILIATQHYQTLATFTTRWYIPPTSSSYELHALHKDDALEIYESVASSSVGYTQNMIFFEDVSLMWNADLLSNFTINKSYNPISLCC